MPTYQYQCPTCGHEFEEFQSMTEKAISECPACKGKTQRVISGGAGFIFKGSGFYITDYRSAGYKADAAKDKPSDGTGSSDKSGSSGASESSGASGASGKSKADSTKTSKSSGSSGKSGSTGPDKK